MNESLPIAAAAGYLLGSLPFGYLVARTRGVDIFKAGSGSSGATNVRRTLGAKAGNTVFVLDVLKGMAAAGWPALIALTHRSAAAGDGGWVSVVAANSVLAGVVGLAGALLGHAFSCFVKFRGGKGVATAAGGLMVLMPLVVLISLVLWIVLFYSFRYVSVASIASALALPVSAWFLGDSQVLTRLAAAIAVFVVVMHRKNVRRLLDGTESRFVPSGERREAGR